MQFTNLYALLMRLPIITFVIQALDNNQVSFYALQPGLAKKYFFFFYSCLINVHLIRVVFFKYDDVTYVRLKANWYEPLGGLLCYFNRKFVLKGSECGVLTAVKTLAMSNDLRKQYHEKANRVTSFLRSCYFLKKYKYCCVPSN